MIIRNDKYGPSGLGHLEIDQRACDLPPGTQRYFEADTYTCSHCERIVVMNPQRKRERYKCKSCNHHVCDDCAAKAVAGERCMPIKVLAEILREQNSQP